MRRSLQSYAPARGLAQSQLVTLVTMVLLVLATQVAFAQKVSSAQDTSEKFSCEGRTAGFYADISSGCQMYHMCDEAGRVFTHTCPERTLFQQRTMVCDHWYMVECNGTPHPPAAPPRARPSARHPHPGKVPVQVVPLGGDPARKRHSQRVIAAFPYQRGNDTTQQSGNVRNSRPQNKLESFKISSLPSSTPRSLDSVTPASIISTSPPIVFSSLPHNFVASTPHNFVASTPHNSVANTPHNFVASTPRNFVASTPRSVAGSTPRSVDSSTPHPFVSSTAKIERVDRPTFVPIIPFQNIEKPQERELRNLNRPIQTVGRAKIERVFKQSVLSSPGDAVISQVQYISPFREPKAEVPFASTTLRPTTQAAPSFIENKYNNPYFESYFRTSFTIEPSTTGRPVQSTTQSYARREEEEDISENKLEIVIPDPRKMFYIPDSNYDPGESTKEGGTILVIELPGKNSMKFERVEVTEARNHDCPQCHPSFLLPGLCRPCVLIR